MQYSNSAAAKSSKMRHVEIRNFALEDPNQPPQGMPNDTPTRAVFPATLRLERPKSFNPYSGPGKG